MRWTAAGPVGAALTSITFDEALRAFPIPPHAGAIADFEGYAVHQLVNVLRDRQLRRALRGVRNEHGDWLTTSYWDCSVRASSVGQHRDTSAEGDAGTRSKERCPVPPGRRGRRGT